MKSRIINIFSIIVVAFVAIFLYLTLVDYAISICYDIEIYKEKHLKNKSYMLEHKKDSLTLANLSLEQIRVESEIRSLKNQ